MGLGLPAGFPCDMTSSCLACMHACKRPLLGSAQLCTARSTKTCRTESVHSKAGIGIKLTSHTLEHLNRDVAATDLDESDEELASQLAVAGQPSAELIAHLKASWLHSRHQVTVLMAQVLRLEHSQINKGDAATLAARRDGNMSPEQPVQQTEGALAEERVAGDSSGVKVECDLRQALEREKEVKAACEAEVAEQKRLLLAGLQQADERVRGAVHEARQWHEPQVQGLKKHIEQLQVMFREASGALKAVEAREKALKEDFVHARKAQTEAVSRANCVQERLSKTQVCTQDISQHHCTTPLPA
jgi:hypothetical protein